MMIKLLKNADVYTPEYLGKRDILIAGSRICRIAKQLKEYEDLADVEVIDLNGAIVTPGYIDMHVHITGGGGEQGPASRVPESQLSYFTRNGVTTVLGLLGTDGVTRSIENLVAKARALNEEGITAYTLTSAYGFPPTTMTGSVEKDIMMITPMVGVKVAVSDHRSSNPTGEDLIKLATSARRGGMLSGNAGIMVMHMGSGEAALDPVLYILDHSDVPVKNLLPTHMLRTRKLMEQGAELIRRGGFIDCTAGSEEEQIDKILELLQMDGVTIDHLTLSSDAFGSQPKFNEKGECIGLTFSSPEFLHKTMQRMVERGVPLSEALKMLTSTPAFLLGKMGIKGCVCENADADLLVLDKNLEIQSVFAKGKTAVLNHEIILKGRFE